MLSKIILAVVYAVIAYLVCFYGGAIIAMLGAPIAVFVGGVLQSIAGVVSILVFLYYAFVGTAPWPRV